MSTFFTNTTIQNRSKHSRLSTEHIVPTQNLIGSVPQAFFQEVLESEGSKEQILYSLGMKLLDGKSSSAIAEFLSDYKVPVVDVPDPPVHQPDILGSVYQYLNSKRENLELGSFYTGHEVAADFVNDLDFNAGQSIFDPACGSGSFLFSSDASPEQIFGVDADPIAIMIAKFNYFIKFPSAIAPNLHCADFFSWSRINGDQKFDYIIGNPPYGANLNLEVLQPSEIVSGESFSYFLEKSFSMLGDNGVFRFLLPQALLNVKRHADVRRFILDKTNLRRIKRYKQKFAGVMSDVFLVELDRGHCEEVQFEDGEATAVPKSLYRSLNHNVFVQLNSKDASILKKVTAIGTLTLEASTFGLGVVTGDNKSKLTPTPTRNSEPIFTGKEVSKYQLSAARNYLVFDRQMLQQVAPDEIYRAPVKLVYKTISKALKFALDRSQALTSNSANILIPNLPGYSPELVMGFLNSDMYSYLHYKLFGGVNKVAKENLSALPFPALTTEQKEKLEALLSEALSVSNDENFQSYIAGEVFQLTKSEADHVRAVSRAL
jgi:tRNA1(Val) A37 N6-methylase TrmN6